MPGIFFFFFFIADSISVVVIGLFRLSASPSVLENSVSKNVARLSISSRLSNFLAYSYLAVVHSNGLQSFVFL